LLDRLCIFGCKRGSQERPKLLFFLQLLGIFLAQAGNRVGRSFLRICVPWGLCSRGFGL
jgi:hypothetical protein